MSLSMAKYCTPERPGDMSQLAKRFVDLSMGRVDDEDHEPTLEE